MSHDSYNLNNSSRNRFLEPPSLSQQAANYALELVSPANRRRAFKRVKKTVKGLLSLGIGSIALLLLLCTVWIYTLLWGERRVFENSVESCDWRHWESWPAGAEPHHVALVADPQLIDPHTYPGRGWPLSSLTIHFTDLYLKRTYRKLQETLYPDSTIFLGDLFDGGREWSVESHWNNPDQTWRSYGGKFWLKEYQRFNKIFTDIFEKVGVQARQGQKGRRRLITSLPGNHDLGFGNGVALPVRERFTSHFGEGNNVNIIGNHTFISVDGPSLSAKDNDEADERIWKPTMEFLNDIHSTRNKAMAEEVRVLHGLSRRRLHPHSVKDSTDPVPAISSDDRDMSKAHFPAVLLTHVPLYRDKGTPCGSMREHWPPSYSPDGKPLEVDERNALQLAAGIQYQNVLSQDLTKDIATKIGDIQYAFSGDDHDYCDVTHRRYPSGGGGIREITVKSVSMAMGIRKPGFVMVSLWNPIDAEGKSIKSAGPGDQKTLQSHLCLLPDQVAIFLAYGKLLVVTLILLAVRASYVTFRPAQPISSLAKPLLPTSRGGSDKRAKSSSLSSSYDEHSKTANARARGNSSVGYGMPSFGDSESDEDVDETLHKQPRTYLGVIFRTVEHFTQSLVLLAIPVLVAYGSLHS